MSKTVTIGNEHWESTLHPLGASEVSARIIRDDGEFNIYRKPKEEPEKLTTGRNNGSYWTDLFGRFTEQRIYNKDRSGYRQLALAKDSALHGARCDQEFSLGKASATAVSYTAPELSEQSGLWKSRVKVFHAVLGAVLEKRIVITHTDPEPGLYAVADHPFFTDTADNRLSIKAKVHSYARPQGGLDYPVPWLSPTPIVPGSDIDFSEPKFLPPDRDETLYGLEGNVELRWENGVAIELEAFFSVDQQEVRRVELLHYFTGRQVSQGISAVEPTMGGSNWNGLYKLGLIPSEYAGIELKDGEELTFIVRYTILSL